MSNERHLRDRRRRRSPFVSFLHSYRIFFGALIFSVGTAIFVAIHLGFFSTLLIYIPLVVICVPALTILRHGLPEHACVAEAPTRALRALCRVVRVPPSRADVSHFGTLVVHESKHASPRP
ncbi:hypothetical protein B0H13DRAFT_1075962 [Mycena leptocephala]|nr:hypothetical protein B0H13DRAFT_1075962 [Mycena leptocephala]